jgi:hypothetical protein
MLTPLAQTVVAPQQAVKLSTKSALCAELVLKVGAACLLAAALAACNTTGRGDSSSAPPPMKPIDTGSLNKPAPAPVVTEPRSAPVQASSGSAPAPAPSRAAEPAPPARAPVLKAPEAEAPLRPIVVQAGLHRCELGKRVLVKRVTSDGGNVQIHWAGKDLTLRSVPTQSGARRFEDSKAGIAWVVISAKAFLLDTKRGQMLTNECKL